MQAYLSRDEFAESRPSDGKKSRRQNRWCKSSVVKTLRRIRLIQLILDITLFSLTIYLLTSVKTELNTSASIILVILFASFAIILCIDAFGQIGGCLLPDLPMFLVALLGFLLFTSVAAQAAYLLIYHPPENQGIKNGFILALIALCLVAAIFFLIDAMVLIRYWRQIYTMKRKCLSCSPDTSTTILYQRSVKENANEILEAKHSKSKPIARDISTSFSRGKQRSSHSGFLGYRSNNRVGVGLRREYVDCETSMDLNTPSKFVETQTQLIQPEENVDHQISAIAVIEEKNVQTLSQCPICSAALDYSPGGICPTFLAMVQSFGMFSCRETLQVRPEAPVLVHRATSPTESKSSFKGTESTVLITKKPPRVYETHPCPTHGAGLIAQKSGLPSQVTRISLNHCIRKNKRTQTAMCKPIMVMERCQNTEINIVVSSFCRSVATLTEGCYSCQDSFSGQESFEKLKTPSESNINLTKIREEVTKTESPRLSQDRSSSKQQDSEQAEIRNEESISVGKIEESTTGISEENYPEFQDDFDEHESFEEVKVRSRESSETTNIDDGTKKDSVTTEKSSSHKILSSFETRDSIPSTVAETIPPIEPTIPFAEIDRHSNESRGISNPVQICKCSQYYYKDVFGRYICSLCSHKYLIKIPQRYTIKPVGDVRCCSCSQAIFHQAPNAVQSKCHRWCRCKCHMHTGIRK